MKNKKTAVLVTSVFLFALAPMALAVTTAGPTSITKVDDLIDDIATWFQLIVFAIAVVMIIYAGFTWMTAGGDEDKTKTARSTLVWALVGIAVALFAGLALDFVKSIL